MEILIGDFLFDIVEMKDVMNYIIDEVLNFKNLINVGLIIYLEYVWLIKDY